MRSVRFVKPNEGASLLDRLRRTLQERLGPRGTLLFGIGVVALFVAIGGPLWVAGISSSLAAALLFAVILVAPAAWVLRDAKQRGLDHAFLWGLFGLAGNVVAVVVYLLVRDGAPRVESCRTCARELRSSHVACPWCGSPRVAPAGACPHCRTEVEPNWRYCPYCRGSMGGN